MNIATATAFDVIELIRETSSTNDKLQILKDFDERSDSFQAATLRKIMYLVYEPTLVFGIKKIPEYQRAGAGRVSSLNDVVGQLDQLITAGHKFNSDSGRDIIKGMLKGLDEQNARVFEDIIVRDLNIGVGATTVRKVYGKNFITAERYMRCSLLDDKAKKRVEMPALVQLKEDGQYTDCIVADGKVTFMSRAMKQTNFGHVFDKMFVDAVANAKDLDTQDLVLQGEIRVLADDDSGKYLDRATGNGLVRRVIADDVENSELPKRFVFVLWDAVDYNQWREGIENVDYLTRLKRVEAVVAAAGSNHVTKVETHVVNSIEEANKLYLDFIKIGEEGAVLKNYKTIWKNGTSRDQFKMKVAFEVDLEIVDFVAGDQKGKHANTFGSILCRSTCGMVECNVPGYSDKERARLWALGNALKGQIMAVEANDIVKARGSDVYCLSHPRCVEIRDDKIVADNLKRIMESFESVTGFRKLEE